MGIADREQTSADLKQYFFKNNMKDNLDNISHRSLAFSLEDGRLIYLLSISRANGGPASHILNTAVFCLQKPENECSRKDMEAAIFHCLFSVLFTTKTKNGDPPDAAPAYEEVWILDSLCPHKTNTAITFRFRIDNGKGASFPINRPL